MANWSQSHFLQSLGWATLNSFWQMALLWCIYLGLTHTMRLNTSRQYQLAAASVVTGFAWFILTFLFFYNSSPVYTIGWFDQSIGAGNRVLHFCLTAASVTYLGLLIFPAYRLFRNISFVFQIRHSGLSKADLNYRLFVQKISGHLGIVKTVSVYVSSLVTSPVTIGYLKPIILLPVAAMNQLSVQQVEAVLLHELSHIRRHDYLVNLLINLIHTFLYFNPFVRLFMHVIETRREQCCDEMVLQFGYDKVGYASALLKLEKSAQAEALVLAATGKEYLLNRIEKIVGMEKKKTMSVRQLAAVLMTVLFILVFNSILIVKDRTPRGFDFAYTAIANPFSIIGNIDEYNEAPISSEDRKATAFQATAAVDSPKQKSKPVVPQALAFNHEEEVMPAGFVQVAQDDVDASLSAEQKQQVTAAVDATKKVMATLQWKEIEKQIGDAMTSKEKMMARQEYNQEIANINWRNLENNMKAQYEKMDWSRINANLNEAMTQIQLDSLQQHYTAVLVQMEKAEKEMEAEKTCNAPIPDASLAELKKAKAEVKNRIDLLKAARQPKQVIKL